MWLTLAWFSCTDDAADSGIESDIPNESGTFHSDSDGDSDSGDTGEVPDDPTDCTTERAVFVDADGAMTDMSAPMLDGTYTKFETPGTLYVCPRTWFARLLIRSEVEVVGLGDAPEDTILSAGEQGTILDVGGEGRVLTVRNLTLDRGAGLDVDHNSGGGGIYCEDTAHVSVEDVIFSQNFANDGPGMYTQYCTADLTRASFIDNLAEDDGGALTFWYSQAVLTDVVFENNEALDGGAIAAFWSEVEATGLEIRGNTATNFGGGMWAQDTLLTMSDSVFEDNVNTGTNGGALLYDGEGAALTRVDFHGNTGVVDGGLFLYWDAVVAGEDCDFSENDPYDIWVSDFEPEDYGHALEAGEGYSFACADNACTEL